MIWKQKYIRTAQNTIIVFSELHKHDEFKHYNPVSAGFININAEKDEHGYPVTTCQCYGESVTLKLKADEIEDSKLANNQILGHYQNTTMRQESIQRHQLRNYIEHFPEDKWIYSFVENNKQSVQGGLISFSLRDDCEVQFFQQAKKIVVRNGVLISDYKYDIVDDFESELLTKIYWKKLKEYEDLKIIEVLAKVKGNK